MMHNSRTGVVFILFAMVGLCAVYETVVEAEQLPEVRELTYTWRGYKIHYRTAGDVQRGLDGDTSVIIFLHGFGASSFAWRHNLPVIAEQYKAVAPDLLGFGKSDKPQVEYSPDIWVNLVHEFARARDFSRVTLVGNGLGGLIAAEYVLKYPGEVDKLVLVNTLGLSYNLPRLQRFFTTPVIGEAAFRLLLRPANAARILRDAIYADPSKVTDDVVDGYYRPFLSPGAIDAYRYVGRRIFGWKLEERFKEINVPTLIVWGEDDRLTSIEDAVKLNNLIPNSTIVAIPGSGHCPHEETPEQFNEVLMRYLKRPGSGAVSE